MMIRDKMGFSHQKLTFQNTHKEKYRKQFNQRYQKCDKNWYKNIHHLFCSKIDFIEFSLARTNVFFLLFFIVCHIKSLPDAKNIPTMEREKEKEKLIDFYHFYRRKYIQIGFIPHTFRKIQSHKNDFLFSDDAFAYLFLL